LLEQNWNDLNQLIKINANVIKILIVNFYWFNYAQYWPFYCLYRYLRNCRNFFVFFSALVSWNL